MENRAIQKQRPQASANVDQEPVKKTDDVGQPISKSAIVEQRLLKLEADVERTLAGTSKKANKLPTDDKIDKKKIKKSPSEHSKDKRPTAEHSFLTDVADVRQMEQGLLQLLDDFHSGNLQAFGGDCTFDKMDQVREQQEKLARLHFELDLQQESDDLDTREARETANRNLGKLMDNLQGLCTSIQNLKTDETNRRQASPREKSAPAQAFQKDHSKPRR